MTTKPKTTAKPKPKQPAKPKRDLKAMNAAVDLACEQGNSVVDRTVKDALREIRAALETV